MGCCCTSRRRGQYLVSTSSRHELEDSADHQDAGSVQTSRQPIASLAGQPLRPSDCQPTFAWGTPTCHNRDRDTPHSGTFNTGSDPVYICNDDVRLIDIDSLSDSESFVTPPEHRHLESTTHQSSVSDDQSRRRWKPSASYSSASFIITNKAITIEWKGHGLKMHIPDNSLAPSLDPSISAQLDVHTHMFANDSKPLAVGYVPLSSLYSIQMGVGKLCRPVTIQFQHCLDISDISDLVILRAADVTEHFEPIDDAVFGKRAEHEYGEVIVPKLLNGDEEYDDFSWFIVALRRIFLPRTIRYKAYVYTSKATMNLKMYFIVTMALELCTMVIERRYPEVSYDLQTSFSVEFDTRRRLSLDIPEDGKKLESGWVITALYNPSITKQQVDRFCIFHNDLPKCELSMQWSAVGSPPERLIHKIDLTEGTANSSKYFCINFDLSRAASAANTMSDNPPTLPAILRILLPVSSQWMNIGTMLSLNHGCLTAIDTRCRGVPDNCLREMLNEWLQQVNPPPTKSALISAVEKYNPSLAEEISAL